MTAIGWCIHHTLSLWSTWNPSPQPVEQHWPASHGTRGQPAEWKWGGRTDQSLTHMFAFRQSYHYHTPRNQSPTGFLLVHASMWGCFCSSPSLCLGYPPILAASYGRDGPHLLAFHSSTTIGLTVVYDSLCELCWGGGWLDLLLLWQIRVFLAWWDG